ncbi:methyltransferase [bacterium]|nr:methyltransferase [bacterium]
MDIAYQTLRVIALADNYNRWIIKMIKPYIRKKILEVGCGVGNLTEYLRKMGELVVIDLRKRYVEYIKLDFPEVRAFNYDITHSDTLSLKKYDFDTVVCVNVLEHIEKDSLALFNMYELMRKGGRLILLVPAHQMLYGTIDQEVGHWRRYSKRKIINKVVAAKFNIESVKYFNRLGMIGWFLNSCLRKKNKVSVLQLLLFDRVLPLISKIESYLNLPWGLSILLVARKD